MKKLLKVSLALLFSLSNMGVFIVHASEEELDPVERDKKLYGTEILEEDVIYDEARGIDRLTEVFKENNPWLKGPAFGAEQEAKYRKYFSSVSWINRSGVWSLSVNYKWIGGISGNKEDSWNILLMFHNKDYRWVDARSVNASTYDSVYHQYTCHYDILGGTKNPYNLEPYVVDKGYWGFVWSACN